MTSTTKLSAGARWIAGISTAALIAGAAFFTAPEDNGGAQATTAPATAAPAPVGVTIARPHVRDIVEWDEYLGRFEAIEEVEVRARVSGYLEEILFEDGQIVQQGDVLFRIDPRPLQAVVAERTAQSAQAGSRVKLAETELERAAYLRDRGHVSQSVYDQRLQTLEAARADLAAAGAALERARLDLDFTIVRAPVTGRISRDFVSVGNLVSGGSPGATLLTNIVSLDPIHFVFEASEAEYLKYQRLSQQGTRPSSRDAANPVKVRLVDEDTYDHAGRMDFVDNHVDRASGTILGRAIFDNPDHLLTPGLFGRLQLVASNAHPAVLLQDAAILTDQGSKYVWVVDGTSRTERRTVTLGPIVDGLRVVRSGLTAEDDVVVLGLQRVRDGVLVAHQPQKGEDGEPARILAAR
ncbi:efflux RND transporter periplasmic adaptor subunit [Eilatimonas milleporae]|uniref:Multidrug efflux system membrane fusion protein n=1 Tax=Eilatimonas milleporae TaxID=911205 RepID=A0A3M0CKY5_9PROT|nr:efflux RND transporter periplasmic adaptor subunit [Eilatimonas milleporae]RMB07686.1 multidrug efflux system membrane fusion protein [Eilatimonas milleporae]